MRKKLFILTVVVMSIAMLASGCGSIKNKDEGKNSQQMVEEIIPETEGTEQELDTMVNNDTEQGSETQVEEQTPVVTPESEEQTQVATPVPTPTPEPEPEVQQPVANNVFFNDLNYAYDVNSLSVKPRYVYWENGKLYAECFVINGFNHTVYNINVKSLKFSNNSVDIAIAGFGGLNNVSIAPYSYIVWTFVFGEDCVITPNADLSVLRCNAQTSNSY